MKKQKKQLAGCLLSVMNDMELSKTAASRILHVNTSTFCRAINTPEDAKYGTLVSWLDELEALSASITNIATDKSSLNAELSSVGLGEINE